MAANQTNIQLQNTTQPIHVSSPSQFLDQAIALETLKLMEKTLGGGKWTWAVAGTVFFILSIDGVKRVIFNIVDKSITYLCNMTMEDWSKVGSAIVTPVKLVSKGISLPFRYAYRKISPEKECIVPTPPMMYPLDCSEELWKMLYIRPEFSFDTNVVSIKHIGNGSELQQTERWSNMRISTPDFHAYFEGNIDVTFQVKSSTTGQPVKLFANSKSSSVQDESLFIYDKDIHTLPAYEIRKKLSNPYMDRCDPVEHLLATSNVYITVNQYTPLICTPSKFDGIMYNALLFLRHNLFSTVDKLSTYYFTVKLINHKSNGSYYNVDYLYRNACLLVNIMYNYTTNTQEITYFYIYVSILYACIGDNLELYKYINSMPTLRYYGGTLLTVSTSGSSKCETGDVHASLKQMKAIVDENIFNGIPSKLVHEFKRWFLMYIGVVRPGSSITFSNKKENTSSSSIHFYMHSELQHPLSHFTSWLSKISTEESTDKKDIESLKIKANYIKIEKSTKTDKVKNPEYDNWLSTAQKLGLLKDQANTDPSGQPSQTVIQANILDKMPPEFLTETSEVTNVKCEHINSVYKGIHTLYLQTADYRKLFTSLDNFKNRKALLQELGFPLKLGILLHGLPGTGKSATILAIASYLQKDIFFVDLRSVKTNSDLKMIFDHILTMNLNGGILVFEDIDCATKTVLQRIGYKSEECNDFDDLSSSTTSVLSDNEGEFTLDYFLNILQGTLTRDNTIFIMTTNYVNKLDSALIRDGRIDVNIEMKLTNKEQLTQMWKTIFKRDINQQILDKFKEYAFKPASVLSRCAEYLTCGDDIIDEEILKPFLN